MTHQWKVGDIAEVRFEYAGFTAGIGQRFRVTDLIGDDRLYGETVRHAPGGQSGRFTSRYAARCVPVIRVPARTRP